MEISLRTLSREPRSTRTITTHYDNLPNEITREFATISTSRFKGRVHTNEMENFWSLLKRGLHGTYISVELFHLFRYVDEQAFRFLGFGPGL